MFYCVYIRNCIQHFHFQILGFRWGQWKARLLLIDLIRFGSWGAGAYPCRLSISLKQQKQVCRLSAGRTGHLLHSLIPTGNLTSLIPVIWPSEDMCVCHQQSLEFSLWEFYIYCCSSVQHHYKWIYFPYSGSYNHAAHRNLDISPWRVFFLLSRHLLHIHAGSWRRRGHSCGPEAVQSPLETMASPETAQPRQQQGQSGAGPGAWARCTPRTAICRGHWQQLPHRGK